MNSPGSATTALPTERKFAVLLFADLSGYTRLCEQLDPEQVVAALHPVMASLRLAAERLGGTICSTAGDGFFVSFGIPTALEDPAYRASACAREMRAVIETANGQRQPVRIPPVHIGIAAGEVLVVPTNEQVGFSLVGSAVNLASRLCDAAPPDAVFVDEQVHRLVRHRATWASPVVLDVKGLDGHVRAWPLEQLADAGGAAETVPFVGRADSFRLLDAERAKVADEQRSRVVVIGGPPGIGKTRLITEWCAQQELGAMVLECGGHTRGSLDDLLNLLVPGGRSAERLPSSVDVRTDLTLTAERPDPYPAMLAHARRLLGHADSVQPAVLVVDDVHDADPSLAAFLDDLRRHPVDSAVLCLVTTRTGDELGHPLDPYGEVDISLSGLAAEEVDELVRAAWPRLHGGQLLTSLVERVAGHPLMTVQVLSYLDENDNVDLTDLPSSLRSFVASRLDRLPASEKGLLQRLSTFGPRFDATDLSAVMAEATQADVQTLIRRLLLRHDETGALQFAHGVVREVAYMSLPRNVRGTLHRQHLQRLSGDADPTIRVFHALRWAEAAAIAAGPERELAASTAMRETHALALDLFRFEARSTHALLSRITPIAYDSAVAAPDLATQLLSLDARCLMEMWDFERAETAAARAVDIANRFDLPTQARLDAAIVHAMTLSRMRRVHSARAVAEEVIATTERLADEVRRGRALRVLASTWRYESLSRFTSLCEESYNVGHDAGDPAAVATAQYLAYLTSTASGNTYERWRRVASAQTEDGDRWGKATLARAAMTRGVYSLDLAAARSAAHDAIELGTELGALDVVGDALLAQVNIETASGRLEHVEQLLEQLSELSEQTGNMRLQMFAWSASALAHLRRGDPSRAEQAIAEARRHSEQFGPGARAEIAYVSALVHADRGDFREAVADFEHARVETTDGPVAIEALLHRVREALISVGARLAIAHAPLERLVDECTDAGAPGLSSFACAVLELHLAQTDGLQPQSQCPASACLEEQGIRADARALSAERNRGDVVAAWQQAASIWQQLGYTVWLARAQARSGDTAAAHHTLDLIHASDEGQAWALQR